MRRYSVEVFPGQISVENGRESEVAAQGRVGRRALLLHESRRPSYSHTPAACSNSEEAVWAGARAAATSKAHDEAMTAAEGKRRLQRRQRLTRWSERWPTAAGAAAAGRPARRRRARQRRCPTTIFARSPPRS
eukprot:scaffold128006_cov69-Phaeocystis_antarctica.AAC.8